MEEKDHFVAGYGSETDGGHFAEKKEYDERGNLVKDYAFLSEGPLIKICSNKYDEEGFITSIESAYGEHPYGLNTFFYNSEHKLDSTCYCTNPWAKRLRNRGLCQYFQYNEKGQQVRQFSVLKKDMELSKANDTISWEHFTWNDSGQLMTFSKTNDKKVVTEVSQYLYNDAGQLILEEETNGKYHTSDKSNYFYNEHGQLSSYLIHSFENGELVQERTCLFNYLPNGLPYQQIYKISEFHDIIYQYRYTFHKP